MGAPGGVADAGLLNPRPFGLGEKQTYLTLGSRLRPQPLPQLNVFRARPVSTPFRVSATCSDLDVFVP